MCRWWCPLRCWKVKVRSSAGRRAGVGGRGGDGSCDVDGFGDGAVARAAAADAAEADRVGGGQVGGGEDDVEAGVGDVVHGPGAEDLVGQDGSQSVGAVDGAGDADGASVGEQPAGGRASGCGEVAQHRGGRERLARDGPLQAGAQQVGGAGVKVGEVRGAVGPQGGQESAAGGLSAKRAHARRPLPTPRVVWISPGRHRPTVITLPRPAVSDGSRSPRRWCRRGDPYGR